MSATPTFLEKNLCVEIFNLVKNRVVVYLRRNYVITG